MEIIITAASALAALIGSIWGIVKYYDQNRAKEQLKKEKQEQEQKKQEKEVLSTMQKTLENIAETNTEQQKIISALSTTTSQMQAQLRTMQTEAQVLQKDVKENEIDRLRTEIIDIYNKLLNGFTLTSVDFVHVHRSYDKYISKGGNSYIEDCMDTIREYEKECREADIIGFNEDKK